MEHGPKSADDRDARNESSYRPDGVSQPWYLSAADALELAKELWQACEPSSNASFDRIDRHILRITLENTFNGSTGAKPSDKPEEYAEFVSPIVEALAFEAPIAEGWKKFLERKDVPEDPIIFSYASQDPLDYLVGHAAVLSRATLLLRLATGSALHLIRSAGISGDKLQFWWEQLGVNRGLWDGNKNRTELLDLWDDVTILFDDVQEFQNTISAPNQTFQLIDNRLSHVVTGLGGCERVAIWSLTP